MNKKEENQYLLNKYDRQVPRYTSFPTSLQFHQNFCYEEIVDCYKEVNIEKPISIYIHIPFCHSLCHYCGCHTKIVHSKNIISDYIQDVISEIENTALILPKNIQISRIHFGGGSPNYPDAVDIEYILNTFKRLFNFTKDISIDMECDPRLLSKDKIQSYIDMGINRISLGIQDFNYDVQKAINRIQSFDMVKKSVDVFRSLGIKSINFDLIVGLPQQTLETIKETMDKVITLQPDRISVFPYAHVPWIKKHQKILESFDLPKTQDRFLMIEKIKKLLLDNGYKSIGIDHYALESDVLYKNYTQKKVYRNFQGYTDDDADVIVGFGVSSISKIESTYIQNEKNVPSYKKSIEERKIPIEKIYSLSEDDKKRAEIIQEIMCYLSTDSNNFTEFLVDRNLFLSLEQDGLLTHRNNSINITEKGQAFTRLLASCLDPYLQRKEGEQKHAQSI